jgi:hypothetical protein
MPFDIDLDKLKKVMTSVDGSPVESKRGNGKRDASGPALNIEYDRKDLAPFHISLEN